MFEITDRAFRMVWQLVATMLCDGDEEAADVLIDELREMDPKDSRGVLLALADMAAVGLAQANGEHPLRPKLTLTAIRARLNEYALGDTHG
jgi:hypothetical protein